MLLTRDHAIHKFVGGVAVVLLLLTGITATPAAAGEGQLSLNLIGLEDLGPGWVYEGWLIVNGAPVSIGVFTVDEQGDPSVSDFSVDSQDLENAATFMVTIEPLPDPDPAPSAVHVLGGDMIGGVALLTMDHPAALGNSFTNISGSYILAAPSVGEDAPYAHGIWWLDPEGGSRPALDLPALAEGWAYEGWVVGPDGPISTGRFTSVNGPDSDGGGPAAGPEATPPFPGQDFINPPLTLTDGYSVVISIEPEPDNSPAPFAFKPLSDPAIEDVGGGNLQAMALNLASFSSGAVTVSTLMAADEAATEEATSQETASQETAPQEAVPQQTTSQETSSPETEAETAASQNTLADQIRAETAPAALPTVGADKSLPLLPIALGLSGLLLLGLGAVIRKRF
jgi:hypothetical protein